MNVGVCMKMRIALAVQVKCLLHTNKRSLVSASAASYSSKSSTFGFFTKLNAGERNPEILKWTFAGTLPCISDQR